MVALLAAAALLSACSGTADPEASVTDEPSEEGISGSITVLTNRTDQVDTVFPEYAAAFNEVYPDVEVSFEARASGCRATLVHGGWETLGEIAAMLHREYVPGWKMVFGECFAVYARR